MSRITVDTKCRLCRAEGQKLYLKGARCFSSKCPIEKKGAVKPGMHGVQNSRKPTDYNIQLRAKQKVKRIYGLQETQFHNLYLKAKKLKGLVGDNLLILLERRLDNLVFLAGFSQSRNHARQLISHKAILINGKKVNISSYTVDLKDEISLTPSAVKSLDDRLRYQEKDFKLPSWLDLNKSKSLVKMISLPSRDEIGQDLDINLIVEYYSR